MPKNFLALCFCIVALCGCQSTSELSRSAEAPASITRTQTQDSPTSGYAALKKRNLVAQDQRYRSVLSVVKTALDASNVDTAAPLLDDLEGTPNDPELKDVYFRLLARTQVAQSTPTLAVATLTRIEKILPEDLTVIREVCDQIGALGCLVEIEVIRQKLEQRYTAQSQDRIWSILQRPEMSLTASGYGTEPLTSALLALAISLPELKGEARQVKETAQGWFELSGVIAQSESPLTAETRWSEWQKRNPSHPAVLKAPEPLTLLKNYQAPKIAILLPLSGRLATVGRAVRDGVTTGFFAEKKLSPISVIAANDDEKAPPSDVRFFDSSKHEALTLLNLTKQQGSNVVVGPLMKSRIPRFFALAQQAQAASITESDATTFVLLNRIENPVQAANLSAQKLVHQFATAIEDEVFTLSKILKVQGHNRLMVVTNTEPWAERANNALIQNWRGAVVTAEFGRPRDITGAVGTAMGVAESQARRENLESFLGEELEFLPRERKDVDAVVAFTNGLEAEALVPALKFHFADELPVFATSQTTRSQNLPALSGFNVTELPMIAKPNRIEQTMRTTFDLDGTPLIEFYALGLDAYRLATWTHWLKINGQSLGEAYRLRLASASGDLIVGSGGNVQRELAMAQIDKRGRLEVIADPQG